MLTRLVPGLRNYGSQVVRNTAARLEAAAKSSREDVFSSVRVNKSALKPPATLKGAWETITKNYKEAVENIALRLKDNIATLWRRANDRMTVKLPTAEELQLEVLAGKAPGR